MLSRNVQGNLDPRLSSNTNMNRTTKAFSDDSYCDNGMFNQMDQRKSMKDDFIDEQIFEASPDNYFENEDRELLDNVSWDTESDEEDIKNDEQIIQ